MSERNQGSEEVRDGFWKDYNRVISRKEKKKKLRNRFSLSQNISKSKYKVARAAPCSKSPGSWGQHQERRTRKIKGFIEPEHETHIKTSSTTNLDQKLLSGQDTPSQGFLLVSDYKQDSQILCKHGAEGLLDHMSGSWGQAILLSQMEMITVGNSQSSLLLGWHKSFHNLTNSPHPLVVDMSYSQRCKQETPGPTHSIQGEGSERG